MRVCRSPLSGLVRSSYQLDLSGNRVDYLDYARCRAEFRAPCMSQFDTFVAWARRLHRARLSGDPRNPELLSRPGGGRRALH